MADACVIGDSLPALAAALELAEVGLDVRVALGERPDWPARGVRDPDGVLASYLTRIAQPIAQEGSVAESALPVLETPPLLHLRDARGAWAPLPEPEVLGIPAVPMSSEALAFLRGGAGFRAYLDRLKPLLTVGKTHQLSRLVDVRLGKAVFERMVQPIVRERFGTPDVEVAIAAPGLNEALTLAGSLSGAALAYAERDVARETLVAPQGGWMALRSALIARLELYGATIAAGPVAADGSAAGWLVRAGESEFEANTLVVDLHAAPAGSPAETLGDLGPQQVRAFATVATARGDAPLDAGEALDTVKLSDGTEWSVRLRAARPDGVEGTLAEISGPALPEPPQAEVRDVLVAAGLEFAGHDPVGSESDAGDSTVADPAGFDPTSGDPAAGDWVVRAAPFTSMAERDAGRIRLQAERAAEDTLLPIGSELHGDDLPEALADAQRAAITLRRRLTGIAD